MILSLFDLIFSMLHNSIKTNIMGITIWLTYKTQTWNNNELRQNLIGTTAEYIIEYTLQKDQQRNTQIPTTFFLSV